MSQRNPAQIPIAVSRADETGQVMSHKDASWNFRSQEMSPVCRDSVDESLLDQSHPLHWERVAFRRDFLSRLPDDNWTRGVFASLPGADFYVKDGQGRYVHASRGILDEMGISNVVAIISTTDADHFSGEFVAACTKDDSLTVEAGEHALGRFELRWMASSGLTWVETTKYLLRDAKGAPLGLLCARRKVRASKVSGEGIVPPPVDDERVSLAVEYIFQQRGNPQSNARIAAVANVSERQLSRLFLRHFRMTPSRFGSAIRIQVACGLLAETDSSVCAIALDCGFSDQSSFTNRFRCFTGTTPACFRKKWSKVVERDRGHAGLNRRTL